MDLIKLIDWTAKRAGGRITIDGTEAATDKPRKIVGIDKIAGRRGMSPIATDKDGVQYELG